MGNKFQRILRTKLDPMKQVQFDSEEKFVSGSENVISIENPTVRLNASIIQ
jgi:hypothetical protein